MNNQISFDINCKNAGLSPNGNSSITISVEDCDKSDLIETVRDACSIREIMDYLDESEVLEFIGVDSVKKYFELTEIDTDAT